MASRQQQHQQQLLALLPADSTSIGNQSLWTLFQAVCASVGDAVTETDFQVAREALVAQGMAIKGKGRGGSTARTTGAARPDFDLKAEVVTPDMLQPTPAPAPKKARAPAPAPAASGEPQVLSYRHADRRVNNPEVGLVSEESDPEQPKTVWSYDPHLDPALQFDSSRAHAESITDEALQLGAEHAEQRRNEVLAWLDHALAGDTPDAMREVITNLKARIAGTPAASPERAALERLRSMGSPHLQWTGKAERTSFDVDTVSLHVHERIDAMSILAAVSKRQGKKDAKDSKTAPGGVQPGLFEAPFESVPLRKALDFYKHDRGWANRLVAGDSLLVMNSLLKKEGMAGQVQMIYIDPPYGIKYGSNFQPFTNKRDVKDRSDADLTQEPEMIKAFRDTWELGIHSYLTYLRDRLLLARDLLNDSGSVFVQISDENLHHVRELMDEIFGSDNYVALIQFAKNSGQTTSLLSVDVDYIVWYSKDKSRLKYHQLYYEKSIDNEYGERYDQALLPDGRVKPIRKLSEEERKAATYFTMQPTLSHGFNPGTTVEFQLRDGRTYHPGLDRQWKTTVSGMNRLDMSNRLIGLGKMIYYARRIDDFPAYAIGSNWTDTQDRLKKDYVVQTVPKVIERCMLMTTDPGDLVLDPTCGSGTTAHVAEKWGRRWITCDTSRVAITLAKQRLMTSSFDYFELRYPHEGLKGGFIYKTVPHVTEPPRVSWRPIGLSQAATMED